MVVFVAGCWSSAPATPVTRDEPPPASGESSPAAEARARTVTWQGFYVCAQGRTALTLTVTGDPAALDGTFEFGPLPENPTVPHGKYAMRGTAVRLDAGEYKVALQPARWIEQPPGYVMVGLEATSSREHDALVGRITDATCGEVALSRLR